MIFDKFEQKEMKKIRPVKNTWYDWLINCIPKPIRKSIGGFKDKIVIVFKTNTPKQTVYGRGRKLSKPKTTKILGSLLYQKRTKKKLKIEHLDISGPFLKHKKKKYKERN